MSQQPSTPSPFRGSCAPPKGVPVPGRARMTGDVDEPAGGRGLSRHGGRCRRRPMKTRTHHESARLGRPGEWAGPLFCTASDQKIPARASARTPAGCETRSCQASSTWPLGEIPGSRSRTSLLRTCEKSGKVSPSSYLLMVWQRRMNVSPPALPAALAESPSCQTPSVRIRGRYADVLRSQPEQLL
jgi:hypothetical protein